ncbi:MAG: hypothetical protein C0469_00335 [Cyanobacteria bacterium DS2.3.42]|nr:hypothetical protein [Cyanobacteria bacterium DS2.3.42]
MVGNAERFSQYLELEDPVRNLYLQCNEVFSERESLSDLSDEACLIYLALVFDLEMRNGGISQFFFNSSGKHSNETLLALRKLDAKISASILEEGLGLLGLQPDDVKSRTKRYETIESKGLDANFERLDLKFYNNVYALQEASREPENLWFLCHDVIERNPEQSIRATPL